MSDTPHANPRETDVLGRHAYASLAEIPERADIVGVFRAPGVSDAT